jgi:YaiO family outer membrane protein
VRADGYRWTAGIADTLSVFTPARAHWDEASASLRYHWDVGSLAAEVWHADRFSLTDQAVALDGYVDLWPRAYANLRYQYSAQAELYPQRAYRAEVFQGVNGGWELSASFDDLGFAADVHMWGAGLGRYVGNWYLRWRTLYIASPRPTGTSNRALARYYYSGDPDEYLEAHAGFSHGGEYLGESLVIQADRGWTAGVAAVKYWHGWGLKLGLDYSDEQAVSPFLERDLSLSLQRRW